jgi:hypothetical protein
MFPSFYHYTTPQLRFEAGEATQRINSQPAAIIEMAVRLLIRESFKVRDDKGFNTTRNENKGEFITQNQVIYILGKIVVARFRYPGLTDTSPQSKPVSVPYP